MISTTAYIEIGIFGHSIIKIWLGDNASLVFDKIGIILCVSFMFHATGVMRHSFMMGVGAIKLVVINGWVAAIMGLMVSVIALPKLGIVGGALGFLPILISGHLTWGIIQKRYIEHFKWLPSYISAFLFPILGAVILMISTYHSRYDLTISVVIPMLIVASLILFSTFTAIDSLISMPYTGFLLGNVCKLIKHGG